MQNMDLSQYPPEIAAQIQALLRQKQMAETLQATSLERRPTEMVSGHAIRQSPLSFLTRAVGAYMGNKGIERGDEQISNIRQEDADKLSQELSGLYSDPTKQKLALALASKDKRIAAAAAGLQKRDDDRLKAWSVLAAKSDAPGTANAFRNETMVPATPFAAPKIEQIDDGAGGKVPLIVNTGGEGQLTGTVPPVTRNTTVINGTEDYKSALDLQKTELETKKAGASVAKEVLSANQFALQALQEGAGAGGGENWKQALRKGLQAFNTPVDQAATTEQLMQALGKAVLEAAQKLKPVSNLDIPFLEKEVGSISSDPQALLRALSMTTAGAVSGLTNYNDYLGAVRGQYEKQSNSPLAQRVLGLLAGQDIGYGAPKTLPGNKVFQLETARQLQRRGFDVSKLEGLPPEFLRDLESGTNVGIDLRSMAPGAASKMPQLTKAPIGPLEVDQLSLEQKQQLIELLGGRR